MKAQHLTLLLTVLSLINPVSARETGPDNYGYIGTDQTEPAGPSYQFVFINTTGLQVVGPGDDISSASPTAAGGILDGGGIGSSVQLDPPFRFYGDELAEITPATNGYLSTDPTDLGLDRLNASFLPAAPVLGGGGRIYPLHDDLVIPAGGGIYYEFLPANRHPHGAVGGAFHAFQWDNVHLFNRPATNIFDFEVLLFDNGDILYQYGLSADPKADGATIGLQNPSASDGLTYSANDPTALPPKPGGAQFFPSFAVLISAPRYVTTTADHFPAPAGSLREALDSLPDNGTIYFDRSIDGSDIQLAGELVIPAGRNAKIIGHEGMGEILAAPGSRLFAVEPTASLELANVTLRGGRAVGGSFPGNVGGAIYNEGLISLEDVEIRDCEAAQDGGGIYCHTFTVTVIDRSTIENCRANRFGGGVFSSGSNLAFSESTISNCRALQDGGGIYFAGSSSLTIHTSRVVDCEASLGNGGGCFGAASTDISYTTLNGNRAGAEGGGLFNQGVANIKFSSLHGNRAESGGGAYNSVASTMNFRVCTIAENQSGTDGGGISNATAGSLNLFSSTVAYNIAEERGGGIDSEGSLFLAGTLTAENKALQAGPDLFGALTTRSASNFIGDSSGATGLTIDDKRDMDAKLGPLSNYGFASPSIPIPADNFIVPLLVGSPAIDASPLVPLTTLTDQRGFPREADGDGVFSTTMMDIGAWEGRPQTVVDSNLDRFDLTDGVTTLREAIELAPASGARIVFDPIAFDGSTSANTIPVSQSAFSFFDKGIIIDATDNEPIRLVASGLGVIFQMQLTANLALFGFEVRDASATAIIGNLGGGGLTAYRCKFVGNGSAGSPIIGSGISVRPAVLDPPQPILGRIVRLFDCDFSDNGFQSGAAVCANRAVVSVRGCLFERNQVSGSSSDGGAAICLSDCATEIERSTFSQNAARKHGAVFSTRGTLKVSNSTFNENTATGPSTDYGGAISALDTAVIIDASTFTQNSADDSGGAIWAAGTFGSESLLRISNSILAHNTAPTGPQFHTSPTEILELAGGNFIGGDPVLAPLGHYGGGVPSMPPLAGSPVIDNGIVIPETPFADQRGFSRIVGATPDIGAVEVGPLIVVNTKTDERDGSIADGDISLRDAIVAATEPGTRIQFDTAVFAGPTFANNRILLTPALGPIELVDRQLSLDASIVPGGVSLSAAGELLGPNPSNSYLLVVRPGSALALHQIEVREMLGTAISAQVYGEFTASDCRFIANSGSLPTGIEYAGAALEISGSARVIDSEFIGNRTKFGGGAVQVYDGGAPHFRRCLFARNHSNVGGAIILSSEQDRLRLSGCAFVENTSDSGGGAIRWSGHGLVAENTTFSGNVAAIEGGAVFLDDFFNPGATAEFAYCTFSNNTAATNGGALSGDGDFILDNCIVSGNSAPSGPDVAPGTNILHRSINLIGGDAMLAPLGDYGGPTPTMFPLPGSPAIDTGDPVRLIIPDTDQRGFPRALGSRSDIGAVETETGLIGATDADGDGMPKWWEDLFGFDDDDPSDAQGDLDGDGTDNVDEFGNHTSPRDPTEYLRITRIEVLDIIGGLVRYNVTWTSWPQLQYHLEGSRDMSSDPWMQLDSVLATGMTTTHTLDIADLEFFTRVSRE